MKKSWMISVVALSVGCGSTAHGPYSPLEKQTSVDAKRLYEAAEGTLLDRGFLLETRDASGFRLVTAPRTLVASQITSGKYRYAFHVDTAGGKLKIELRCDGGEAGGVKSCGDSAPKKLVAEQHQIAEATIAEAEAK